MKIVLTAKEIGQMIVDHLVAQGKIEDKQTDVTWCIGRRSEDTIIVVSQ